MNKDLVIIFTKNPRQGKVKTRLARSIGNTAALAIYMYLLKQTMEVTRKINAQKQVYYSEDMIENDIWDPTIYDKKLQQGNDLGARMEHAFKCGFEAGYSHIVLVGCDIHGLEQENIEMALGGLRTHDVVIGPAKDGGYYLIGMNQLRPSLFQNKIWGTNTVLSDTLKDLENISLFQLPVKNDIDLLEDIEGIAVFEQFLK